MNEPIEGKKTIYRIRKPNKKWSDIEAQKILDFIIETTDEFEEPTLKAYYTKLLNETKIDAQWNLVKEKVRNMRISYFKAREFSEEQSNAGLPEREIKLKVLRMCRDYERLHRIYGDTFGSVVSHHKTLIKSDSQDFLDENSFSSHLEQTFAEQEEEEEDLTAEYTQQSIKEQTATSAYTVVLQPFVKKIIRSPTPPHLPSKSKDDTIEHITISHAQQKTAHQLKLSKQQFDKELKIQDRQFKLVSEQLNAEDECRYAKIELEKLEMKKEEVLKKLEIEKNERIAMYEIQEKFNFEKECQNREFALKKLKMEKDLILKKLEIEKNERIAMFEIEMKYKMATTS